jgi:transcriptional regulator with XRE-family HTH domain
MKPVELRKLRERAGMTPTDLGAAIGVSARTIDRWESGQVRITRLHVKAIMAALGYTDTVSA